MIQQPSYFWNVAEADLLARLESHPEGLSSQEARRRLIHYGANLLKPPQHFGTAALFFAQFKNPIVVTLIFAAGLSFFLQDQVDGGIILFIVVVSGLLGFWQERGAADAVEKLLAMVKIKTTVFRDSSLQDIALEEVVPGDIVTLNAGDAIPADSLILESKDLFVDEATLTGETYPVEKNAGHIAGGNAPQQTRQLPFYGNPCHQRRRQGRCGVHREAGRIRQNIGKAGTQKTGGRI